MFSKVSNGIVKNGETIIDNQGKVYSFMALTQGRVGPKVLVSQSGFQSGRELFNHLFDTRYYFKELTQDELEKANKTGRSDGKEESN